MRVLPLPPPPFRRIYPVRALVLWGLLRAGTLFFGVLAREPAREIVALSLPATLGLLVLIGVLADLDARRRDEYIFLANLGFRRVTVPALSGLVAAVAEIVLRSIPW
jgi:hypothetical protein